MDNVSSVLRGARAPALKVCSSTWLCMTSVGPTQWLPTVSEIRKFSKQETIDRAIFFFVVGTTIAICFGLLMAIIRLAVNAATLMKSAKVRDGPGADKNVEEARPLLPSADQNNQADESAYEEPENSSNIGYTGADVAFAFYQASYIIGCMNLTFYAKDNRLLSKTTGLDYELYIIWEVTVLGVHLTCAVIICARAYRRGRQLRPFVIKTMVTMAPVVGEKSDMLRDCITTGIYTEGETATWLQFVLVAVSVASILLPNFFIYQDPAALASLRSSYWPVFSALEEDAQNEMQATQNVISPEPDVSKFRSLCNDCWKTCVAVAEEQTRPHRQWIYLCEDSLQSGGGLIYISFVSYSTFVLANSIVALTRTTGSVVARPWILGWCAAAGIPWMHVTVEDVGRAVSSQCATHWRHRSKAARDILPVKSFSLPVRIAAVQALMSLFDSEEGKTGSEEEEWIKEHDKFKKAVVLLLAEEGMKELAKRAAMLKDKDEILQHVEIAEGVERLKNKDEEVRKKALRSLESKNYPEFYLDEVLARYQDPSATSSEKIKVLNVIASLPEIPKDNFKAILELAATCQKDVDKTIRAAVTNVWQRLERENQPQIVVDYLAEGLVHGNAQVQQSTLTILGDFREQAEPLIDKVIEYIHSDNEDLKFEALQVLPKISESEKVYRSISKMIGVEGEPSPSNQLTQNPRKANLVIQGLRALRTLGKAASPSAFTVASLLKYSPTLQVKIEIVNTLLAFNDGETLADYTKELLDLLHDKEVAEAIFKDSFEERVPLQRFMATRPAVMALVRDKVTAGDVKSKAKLSAMAHLGSAVFNADAQELGSNAKVAFEALSSDIDDIRVKAVELVAYYGGPSVHCVDKLASLSKTEDNYSARSLAYCQIVYIGKEATQKYPQQLVNGLADVDPYVAGCVERALAALGHAATFVIPHLKRLFSHPKPEVRVRAATVLGNYNDHIEVGTIHDLCKLHGETVDEDLQEAILGALVSFDSHRNAVVKYLLDALRNAKSDDSRASLVTHIGDLGRGAASAADHVAEFISSPIAALRDAAFSALGSIGGAAARYYRRKVLAALEEETTRHVAANTLMLLGESDDAEAEFETLKPFLDSQKIFEKRTGITVAIALGLKKGFPARALQMLCDDDADVQDAALYALPKVYDSPKEWVPNAMRFMSDEKCLIKQSIAKAVLEHCSVDPPIHELAVSLGSTWNKEVAYEICKRADVQLHHTWILHINNRRSVVHLNAMDGVVIEDENMEHVYIANLLRNDHRIGPIWDSTLKKLRGQGNENALRTTPLFQTDGDCDAFRRYLTKSAPSPSVVRIVGEIESNAVELVPCLMKLLTHPSEETREAAVTALGKVGFHGSQLQALVPLLRDLSPSVRTAAVRALGTLATKTATQTPSVDIEWMLARGRAQSRRSVATALVALQNPAYIEQLVKSPDADVRAGVAVGLGEFVAMAQQFVKALAELCQDVSASVRAAAAHALGGLQARASPHAAMLAEMLADKSGYVSNVRSEHLSTQEKVEARLNLQARPVYITSVRAAAEDALKRLGKEHGRDAVPVLQRLLRDGCPAAGDVRVLLRRLTSETF